MLNEKVFKPPSQFVDVTTDNKINLFDYSPGHRGVIPSCAFDIPHQITVVQTNFPQIKFADVKAIGAILYVLDDVASEVLTAMNVYDQDYFETDLDSFVPKETYKITSESEDINDDVNDIEEEDANETEMQNDDDVIEHQLLGDEVELSNVSEEELFSTDDEEDIVENDLIAESSSENADNMSTAEIDIVTTESNSSDEIEDEDKELDQEEIEEQEEIESDACDSEIDDESLDQQEGEEQEINFESSSTSNDEIEKESFGEDTHESVSDITRDERVIDLASDISSNQQALFAEVQQHSENMSEKLFSGVATLLEKLSMFTEERKRTPYLTSPVCAEKDITSEQSSEAETLRDYSISAPAA